MDFRQLEAFVNVARYRNFSRAGKALFLSQPTISLHVSNLEKELNTALFDRTSKEVNLTPAGAEFLNYALDMINMKNRAIHNIISSQKKISGSITISTSTTPSLVLLPAAIEKFQSLHPEVKFIVEEKSSQAILEDVCSLTSDLGLIGMQVENERFISQHLFDDELVFICAEQFPLDGVVDIEDIANYKFISRSDQSATRIELERVMSECGYDISLLENIVESDNMNLTIQLVSGGVGISYMSKTIFECYKKTIPVKSFQIRGLNIVRKINILTNRRRTLSPAAEDFIKLLNNTKKAVLD
jgi:DNA-binding transcriptional LysR family regulator